MIFKFIYYLLRQKIFYLKDILER